MAEIDIAGLAELEARLDALPGKVIQRIDRSALRKGAKVIADLARAKCPKDSGALQASIRVSTRTAKNGHVIGVPEARIYAGNKPLTAKKQAKFALRGKDDVFYAYWVEFGTKAHIISAQPGSALAVPGGHPVAKVVNPGAVAKPFMRPAFDHGAQAAVETFRDDLASRIDDYVADTST